MVGPRTNQIINKSTRIVIFSGRVISYNAKTEMANKGRKNLGLFLLIFGRRATNEAKHKAKIE